MPAKKTKAAKRKPAGKMPFGTAFVGVHSKSQSLKPVHKKKALEFLIRNLQNDLMHTKSPGDGYEMGGPTTFSATRILYHRLHISESYEYSYLEGSGIFRSNNGSNEPIGQYDFNDFIEAVQDGDASAANQVVYLRDLYNMSHGAPHIVVKERCWVVVELNGPTDMILRTGLPAVRTADDLSDIYFNLYHLDTAGDPGYPKEVPENATCVLFYFCVDDVADFRNDRFNLYLQISSMSSVVFVTVDPFIKNRGGTGTRSRGTGRGGKS